MQLTRGFAWAFVAAFSTMFWTGLAWVVTRSPFLLDTARFSAEVALCVMFLTAILYKVEERNAKKKG